MSSTAQIYRPPGDLGLDPCRRRRRRSRVGPRPGRSHWSRSWWRSRWPGSGGSSSATTPPPALGRPPRTRRGPVRQHHRHRRTDRQRRRRPRRRLRRRPGARKAAEEIAAQDFPDDPRVLVISVDGLGSLWVTESSTPTLADLLAQGAGTLNARTAVEKTVTLPNHTGMVTGDRVNAAQGGHGVTWNETSTRSVVPGTDSVFSTIDDEGGSSCRLRRQGEVRDVGTGVAGHDRRVRHPLAPDRGSDHSDQGPARGRPRPGVRPPGRAGQRRPRVRVGAAIPISRPWHGPTPTSTGSCPRSSTTPSSPRRWS